MLLTHIDGDTILEGKDSLNYLRKMPHLTECYDAKHSLLVKLYLNQIMPTAPRSFSVGGL